MLKKRRQLLLLLLLTRYQADSVHVENVAVLICHYGERDIA